MYEEEIVTLFKFKNTQYKHYCRIGFFARTGVPRGMLFGVDVLLTNGEFLEQWPLGW